MQIIFKQNNQLVTDQDSICERSIMFWTLKWKGEIITMTSI